MTGRPRRVAVVLMSAVGSTVQGMPIVASLRRGWPGAHITWVLQPGPAALMAGRPDIDRVLLFHRRLGARAYARFRRDLSAEDAAFDMVINLQPNFKAGVVTRLLPSEVRLGHDRARARDFSWLATNRRIPPSPVAHVQDELFEFLDFLRIERRCEWNFHFSREERQEREEWRRGFARPILAVVPRSSNPRRNWTLAGMARVMDIAAGDLGLEPAIVGGDSREEARDARRVAAMCSTRPRVALGGTLRQLAGRLRASDIVVAPDTGPLHMAVALGTPTIGLYGYTDPKRSGPYRRFQDLLVDRHARSGERRPSRATRPGRMEAITAEDVVDKLELAIRRYMKQGRTPSEQEWTQEET